MRNWLGAKDLRAEMLPTFGLVVDNCAMGFLYQTDSSLCFIENYVANPEKKDTEERNLALDKLTEELAAVAKRMGYKYLWSHTACPAIVERAKKHGFVADETNIYRSIFLNLEKE